MITEALSVPARPMVPSRSVAACPCCGSNATEALYRVAAIPVHSCALLDTAEEARAFPQGDLELAYCDGCGFLFNRTFDERAMAYSANFEESQHFSGTFNAFAKQLAGEIAEKCSVAGRHVLEIGCGKGEFLRELCRVSGATGLGIDPAYRADPGRSAEMQSVHFIADYFGSEYQRLRADVILCRHTLEHIARVAEFVRAIRAMSSAGEGTWTVFETPDAKRVLAEGAFWDIYYEHCSYFSSGSHARLFRQEEFEVTDLRLMYNHQYIVQYAKPARGRTRADLPLEDDLEEMRRLAAKFARHVETIRQKWHERIRSASARGRRIVLWGGGSKAVSFLTTLRLGEEVQAAVDINPYKQGKFTPGTGHPVIAPQALVREPPDMVVVMNSIYANEVKQSLKSLELHPEVVSV